jgi:hypothetical protein
MIAEVPCPPRKPPTPFIKAMNASPNIQPPAAPNPEAIAAPISRIAAATNTAIATALNIFPIHPNSFLKEKSPSGSAWLIGSFPQYAYKLVGKINLI